MTKPKGKVFPVCPQKLIQGRRKFNPKVLLIRPPLIFSDRRCCSGLCLCLILIRPPLTSSDRSVDQHQNLAIFFSVAHLESTLVTIQVKAQLQFKQNKSTIRPFTNVSFNWTVSHET